MSDSRNKKIEYLIKHNRFVQFMYKVCFSALFSVLSFFIPIKKNLILFSSFSGKKFNDSPKVLYEALVQRGMLEKYCVVWAFDNPKLFEQYNLRTVKINSFKYFLTAFRAKYWITNVNIERGLNFKKRRQIYLNTWHGTGPKAIGNAATGRKDYNFKKVDYLCADGDYLKNIFIKDFNAKPDSILLCGRPREDILYESSKEIEIKMKQKYGIKKDDFVILYAPTWREPKDKNSQSTLFVDLDFDKILKSFPNSKILFRAHSITTKIIMPNEYGDRIISATDEPDISSLFFITDVLITDYSSANLDLAILKKPFICYAPDYDVYIKERSLCFDLNKEYPFGVQKTTDEVIEILAEIQSGNKKIEKLMAFKLKYAPFGGNATNICLDKLFNEKDK